MSVKPEQKPADTYLNPVYRRSFPDPFVLRHGGHYFAYATGHAKDGRIFDVLTSTDLVNWDYVAAAMEPLDDPAPFYWAPEVVHSEGKFYLYYSVGNETLMHLRVAVSDSPEGGFLDAGVRLTSADFAIDAHVFIDEDGQRYLFYATDFLEHSHIGTGTVVDRMIDWFTLEGNPRPVTRAKYDWQVYDPARQEKGGVRWHTVEGPAVIKHKGTYFEMYSGGNWQNTSYGVSFATTDDITVAEEWNQFADGETVLPLLRTVPGKIVGPGHNSIVRGPNGRELYCVYHRWTDAGRVMAIDRMDFVGKRMFIIGATDTPQPMPFEPTVHDAGADRVSVPSSFLCEFMLQVPPGVSSGIRLSGDPGTTVLLSQGSDFDPTKLHSYRVEVDDRWMKIVADDWYTLTEGSISSHIDEIEVSGAVPLDLSALTITKGFEDHFDRGSEALRAWSLDNGRLLQSAYGVQFERTGPEGLMSRNISFDTLELSANLHRVGSGEFGLLLLDENGISVFRLAIQDSITVTAGGLERRFALPDIWDPDELHQYRVIVRNGRAFIYLEDALVGNVTFSGKGLRPALFTTGTIAIDMVRATAI